MDDLKSIIGVLAGLAVTAFLLTGGADQYLFPSGEVAGVRIGPVEGPERQPGSSPDDLVAFHSDQWGTHSDVAVAAGPTHFWIEDVLTGFDPRISAATFTQGRAIADHGTCAVTSYDGTSPVMTVLAMQSGRDLGISFQQFAILTSAADTLIDNYGRSGYRGGLPGPGRKLEIVDVVVPATEQPVHLALLSTRDAIVWSFHFEEGAALAGVTLIGGQAGGVLNLPDGVTIEALSARTMNACDQKVMVQEYYDVGPEGRMSALVDEAAAPAPQSNTVPTSIPELEDAIATARPDSFRLWKTSFEFWFSQQFGVNPRANIAGYQDVQVAVAGPAPNTPPIWTPPENGVLRLTNGPVYIIGNSRTRSDAWSNVIVQVAEQKLGAPLATIHPDNQPADQTGG